MKQKKIYIIPVLTTAVLLMAAVCLFTGSSGINLKDGISALFGKGAYGSIRIIRLVRLPRILAAIIAGAGLSLSGHIMQTVLNNPMASPATLGVSNAAVFGANISIIFFSGGFTELGNRIAEYNFGFSPFATSLSAFIFAVISVLMILGLCRLRSFTPAAVVLSGIAMGSVWTAATTVLQYSATDVGLSAAVIWSFGDLGRATFRTDIIMLAVVLVSLIVFMVFSWQYNTLLSGENTAASLGVNVARLRFVSLLTASVITAVCVSFLGMIGFVGMICPHIIKKITGQDHRISLPSSALCGSLLLLCADFLSRFIGKGSALPVGAVTSLLGAPFFIAIILFGRRNSDA